MTRTIFTLAFVLSAIAGAPTADAAPAPSGPRQGPAAGRVATLGAGTLDSGLYQYDALGNITGIGADSYTYDTAQRLVSGTADVQRSGSLNEQHYTYDSFGNRTSAARSAGSKGCVNGTDCEFPVTIDSATNHITSDGAAYDDAGNLKVHGAAHYTYDSLNMLVHETELGNDSQFVYTSNDERIGSYSTGAWTWAVRDTAQKILREFTSSDSAGTGGSPGSSNRAWKKDYVWRDGPLVAAIQAPSSGTSAAVTHFHGDQLGTARLVTDSSGTKLGFHAYYPFGAELDIAPHENPEEAIKFTGHERDITTDIYALDYMHARYYSGSVSRFTSVDAVRGRPLAPQSWNRYCYVRNSPIRLVDPDGRVVEISSSGNYAALKAEIISTLQRPDGRAAFAGVANDANFHQTFKDGTLTSEAQVQFQMHTKQSADITFGQSIPKFTVLNGKTVVNGSTTTVDTARVGKYHPDKSGVTTVVHELHHDNAMRTGGNASAGDLPKSSTGPAEQEGQRVQAQQIDYTQQQAEQFLQQLIATGAVKITK